jgi:hypothetical protein
VILRSNGSLPLPNALNGKGVEKEEEGGTNRRLEKIV